MRPAPRDHPIGTPVRRASLKIGKTTATHTRETMHLLRWRRGLRGESPAEVGSVMRGGVTPVLPSVAASDLVRAVCCGHDCSMDDRDLLRLCRRELIARLEVELPPTQEIPHETELVRALQDALQWANTICGGKLNPWQCSGGCIAYYDSAGHLRVDTSLAPVIRVQALSFGARDSVRIAVDPHDVRIGVGDGMLTVPHAVRLLPGELDPKTTVVANYVCTTGWATTALHGAVSAGDDCVEVNDQSVLSPGREYQLVAASGTEEPITVRSTWTNFGWTGRPIRGIVPLSMPLARFHAEGTTLTDVPRAVCKALASYATALLRAWAKAGILEEADPHPDTALNNDTRFVHPKEVAQTLVEEAELLLAPYRR
jgi:hypothetical protein